MSSTEKGKKKHTTLLRNGNMTKKIALHENKLIALKCTKASSKVEVNPFPSTASRSIGREWLHLVKNVVHVRWYVNENEGCLAERLQMSLPSRPIINAVSSYETKTA